MNSIGEGVAFGALVAAATVLELQGLSNGLLWFVIIFWALFTDWGQKESKP